MGLVVLLSCCVLCWEQLPPSKELGQEKVWKGEQSWSLEQALVPLEP